MRSIQEITTLRPEVVEGRLHGIVSLAALIDEAQTTAFERDPQQVLDATFLSTALKRLLTRVQVSLSTRDIDRKGNFVISGGYGSGKSHLLLTLYHILAHPDIARPWLERYALAFDPPQDAVVVLMPMTNLNRPGSDERVAYLWEPVFDALDYTGFRHTGDNFPSIMDLRKAVAGRKVFLIIDEIERWFMPIQNRHLAEANISFLQNLTEFARDPDNGLFAFLTLLMLEPRISNIVGRDDAFFEDLTGAPDRRKVVLHRLVQAVEPEAAQQIVDAYLEQYRPVEDHVRIGDYNHYRQEMLECYPFHPATIAAVFERYSSVARREETSYQNSRGALYLLSHVLQETLPPERGHTGALQARDMLLPGDIALTIDCLVDDLINLDPPLVDIARENVKRSVAERIPYAAPILSTVLLHSLGDPKSERRLGAEFGEILLGTLRPGNSAPFSNGASVTASGVQMALQLLEDTALNVHFESHPPRWLFRTEVNIVAQINRRAKRDIRKDAAQGLIVRTLKELVGGAIYVYPFDDVPDQRALTLVLTMGRMESDAILDELYYGRAYPNALVIVDPRDMDSVAENPDLLWIARRILAADALRYDLVGDPDAQRRVVDFLDGINGQRQNLKDQLRDRYGAWRAPIYDPSRGDMTFTRVQVPLERGAIFSEVERRYDTGRFRENVMDAVLSHSTPLTVADLRAEFLKQRSFAKPVQQGRPSDAPVDQAIRDLVAQAKLEVIKGGDERYICGRDPGMLHKPWTVAVPPEAHKPRFRLGEVVQDIVKAHPEGVSVEEVYAQCAQEARAFPDAVVDKEQVNAQLTTLIASNAVESSEKAMPVFGPLPDAMVVRPPQPGDLYKRRRKPPRAVHEALTFGPASIPQLKTDVIQWLDKSDILSEIKIEYRCAVHGDDLSTVRELVGMESLDLGDAQLNLSWMLKPPKITNRDALMALLNRLPYPNVSQVTVELRRERGRREP